MGKEIERKFLVTSQEFKGLAEGVYIHQGFLNTDKERVVRVRIYGDRAFLTVKGITKGATRAEFEYEIPPLDAEAMLSDLCEKPTIEKHRYSIDLGPHTWEVDEFHGENEGLVIAEIELTKEEEEFEKPSWIGPEVTSDPRYFNANLVNNPYKNWK
jgi:adenylate cyclase